MNLSSRALPSRQTPARTTPGAWSQGFFGGARTGSGVEGGQPRGARCWARRPGYLTLSNGHPRCLRAPANGFLGLSLSSQPTLRPARSLQTALWD